MAEIRLPRHRMALIRELAARAPGGAIGRTALMKFMYLLQTIRGVPLGYDFTLYSYGPYDKAVLNDLDLAETFGEVAVQIESFSGGYGYRITASNEAEASEFIDEHAGDIDWVVKTFGRLSAAELELISTIVFADREAPPASQSIAKLSGLVHEIKPHFDLSVVQNKAEWLRGLGLLESIA